MYDQYDLIADSKSPPPFPEGWYFVATRREVLAGKLIQKTWMGENIVAWCDGIGRICVAEAFCPHLGSDLGPATGGRICEGRLVCPFHGFEYDVSGKCVATPFADPPKSARLRVFETREILGLIFAWWGIGGRESQWDLPEEPSVESGWSDLLIHTLRFPGHPQEVTENAVDLAHLRYVHGYDRVTSSAPLSISGPCLETGFDFLSSRRVAKVANLTFDTSTRTQVFGLGYSYVEIRERNFGLDLRLWVLATPVDGTKIDLSLVSQVGEVRDPRHWMAVLRVLPKGVRTAVVNRFMSGFQRADVLQDVAIWSRKRYLRRPRLCRSDGEIMRFRAFCAQFYLDALEAASDAPVEFGATVP